MTVLEMGNIAPTIELEVQEIMEGSGSGEGTDNYEKLKNKPSINKVVLSGDKSFEDLGLSPLSNLEIMGIINRASNEGGMNNGNTI